MALKAVQNAPVAPSIAALEGVSTPPVPPRFVPQERPTFRRPPATGNGRQTITIVGLVGLVPATALAFAMGALVSMATDGCSPETCDSNLTSSAALVGVLGPVAVLLLALPTTLVLLLTKRAAAPVVPFLGLGLLVACFLLASYLMRLGAGI